MATFYGLPDNRDREVITGSDGDDLIYPLGGWDVVQGRGGIDSVFVYGEAAGFTVTTEEGITYIDALSGASAGAERAQLYDVERIVFLDEVVDLTLPRSFVGHDGGDIFVGGAGRDTATWAAPRGQFRIERVGDQHFVTDRVGAGGIDRLQGVERLVFSDGKVALDLGGAARDAARLVGTLLGPAFVSGSAAAQTLVGQVLALFDQGQTLAQVAQLAVGALGWNTETVVGQVLLNVWGRPATSAELVSVSAAVQGMPAAEVATLACNLGLIDARIHLVGLADAGLPYL
jgi:Ca2+-binding RTX toxin-like protein